MSPRKTPAATPPQFLAILREHRDSIERLFPMLCEARDAGETPDQMALSITLCRRSHEMICAAVASLLLGDYIAAQMLQTEAVAAVDKIPPFGVPEGC